MTGKTNGAGPNEKKERKGQNFREGPKGTIGDELKGIGIRGGEKLDRKKRKKVHSGVEKKCEKKGG